LTGGIVAHFDYSFTPESDGTRITVKADVARVPWPHTANEFRGAQDAYLRILKAHLEKKEANVHDQ